MKVKAWLVAVCCGVFLVAGFAPAAFSQQQENLTVTTYYPSPFGSYNDLQVSNAIYITSATAAAAGNAYAGPGLVFNFPPGHASVRNDAGIIRAVIPAADDFQLQMTVSDNSNDRIYIGGHPGGIFGGAGGMLITATGDTSLTAAFASTASNPVLDVLDSSGRGVIVVNDVIYCP